MWGVNKSYPSFSWPQHSAQPQDEKAPNSPHAIAVTNYSAEARRALDFCNSARLKEATIGLNQEESALGKIAKNEFQTHRGLPDYTASFPPEFLENLEKLRSSEHWLDSGSGESLAIEGYLKWARIDAHARVTGITYSIDRDLSAIPSRMRVMRDRFLEEIPNEEITHSPFGKPKIITDLFGPIAYSPDIRTVLKKYMELIDDQGMVYLHFSLPQVHVTQNPTYVIDKKGEVSILPKWIENLKGIKVTALRYDSRASWGTGGGLTLKLEQIKGEVPQIPKLKLICQASTYSPPIRVFVEQ